MMILVVKILIMENPLGCDPLDPPSHPARSCARHCGQDHNTHRTTNNRQDHNLNNYNEENNNNNIRVDSVVNRANHSASLCLHV